MLLHAINIKFIFEEKNWNELLVNHSIKHILDKSIGQSYSFCQNNGVFYSNQVKTLLDAAMGKDQPLRFIVLIQHTMILTQQTNPSLLHVFNHSI